MGATDTSYNSTTALDEVTLVPTSSGGVLEDRGKVTLGVPDAINPQLTTPSFTNKQLSTSLLTEIVFARQRKLLALTLLAPLNRNDFASDLHKILAAVMENQEEFLVAAANLASDSSPVFTKISPQRREHLQTVIGESEKAEKKLLRRISKLFKTFSEDNNWPRLLAAWKILIQPEFAPLVEKTEWLEVLARQAWHLLGKHWQQQAQQAVRSEDGNLDRFFAAYSESGLFATTALGKTTAIQLREFLTPVILSFTAKSPEKDEVREAKTVWGQYLAAREVVALRAQLKKLQDQVKQHKNSSSSAASSTLTTKINQLQRDLTAYQDSSKLLALKSLDEDIKLQQLQAKLTQSQAQAEQFQQQVTQLQTQLEQSHRQATKSQVLLEQRVDHLDDQNQALEKYLTKLDQENAQLRELPTPAVKTAALEKRLDNLAATYQDSRLEISNLRQLNEQLELEVAATKQANWRLEQENDYVPTSPAIEERKNDDKPVLSEHEIFPAVSAYSLPEADLVAPELPQFEAPIVTAPNTADRSELKTFTPEKHHLQILGLTTTRLSASFPLFSRHHQSLSFMGISEELERVLGGSLYALEKSRR